AAIDLSALFALLPPTDDPCIHFSSVYLKSRSSASFTAETKDFIAPLQAGVVIFNPNIPNGGGTPNPTFAGSTSVLSTTSKSNGKLSFSTKNIASDVLA